MRASLRLLLAVAVLAAAGCGGSSGAPTDNGTCQGSQCGTSDGGTPPLPSSGAVFQTFASGSSYGDKVQSAPNGHTNIAVMGEPTPPAVDGRVSETSPGGHQNISGLNAVLH